MHSYKITPALKKSAGKSCFIYKSMTMQKTTERTDLLRMNIPARIISAALSAVLMLSSSAAGAVYSAESTVGAEALTDFSLIKSRLDIPETASEFTYTKETLFSSDCYKLQWSTPDKKESFRAGIINDTVVYFSHSKNSYDRRQYTPSLAKLTDEELIGKAKSHLKKLNPHAYAKGVYTLTKTELYGAYAFVSFQRKENGIIVDGNGFTITLDKDTGELCSLSGCWWDNAVFDPPENRLDTEEAWQAFERLCSFKTVYSLSNYDGGELYSGTILHHPQFCGSIDAFTGKASSMQAEMSADGGSDTDPHGYIYISEVALGIGSETPPLEPDVAGSINDIDLEIVNSEAETIASEKLISKDRLKAILCSEPYIKLDPKAELENCELYFNIHNNRYYYAVSFLTPDSLWDSHFYIDASTGSVSFINRTSEEITDESGPYPVEKNLKLAKSAAVHFYPEKCGEYRSALKNRRPAEENEKVREYEFIRYKNGIPVECDSILIRISESGYITLADCSYTNAEFDEPAKADRSKVYDAFRSNSDMELFYDGYYKPDGTVKTCLVYRTESFTLNADHEPCTYHGLPLDKPVYVNKAYKDITGHRYEKAIRAFARYNILLPTEKGYFMPDKEITSSEFMYLLDSIFGIDGDDIDDESPVLTRKEAAQRLTEVFTGEPDSIYGDKLCRFSDVAADDVYAPYIAAADELGLMQGKNGRFYPDSTITRGTAMQLLYNLLYKHAL